jgi:hypothetical protein
MEGLTIRSLVNSFSSLDEIFSIVLHDPDTKTWQYDEKKNKEHFLALKIILFT